MGGCMSRLEDAIKFLKEDQGIDFRNLLTHEYQKVVTLWSGVLSMSIYLSWCSTATNCQHSSKVAKFEPCSPPPRSANSLLRPWRST
jgi:hypothetical protein